MKNIISCSIAGLALLANAANAGGMEGYGVPSNISVYGGGSIGMATHEGACLAANASDGCEDSMGAYKAFAGVRASPNPNGFVVGPTGVMPTSALPTVGMEAGYMVLGESTAQGHVGRPAPGGFDADFSSDLSASYLAGVGYVPVAPRTELLGKAGAAFWEQKGKRTVAEDSDQDIASTNSGTGLLVGGGAQYKVNDNLSVRGEYEHIFGTAKDTNYESDAGLLSVGAVFSTL